MPLVELAQPKICEYAVRQSSAALRPSPRVCGPNDAGVRAAVRGEVVSDEAESTWLTYKELGAAWGARPMLHACNARRRTVRRTNERG